MTATAPVIPTDDDPLAHALALAALGLRVLPIKPGEKRPTMASWQHAATNDPDTLRKWWTGLYRGYGVGLAMGPQPSGRWLFALDVDEHDPAQSGSETLAELESIHGPLPDTVRSITGSGGLHLIFDAGGVPVTNGPAGVAGPGLDVRGGGGQILVHPTLHPNGTAYEWEAGYSPWEHDIAPAPAWLLELVGPKPEPEHATPAERPQVATTGDETPADWLRTRWDWPTELAAAGWTLGRVHGDTEHWTRPGKSAREGTSGVLHLPDGPFVVFTTDASAQPMWRAGKIARDGSCVSLSPLAFHAATHHGGDLAAATRAVRQDMPQAPATSLACLVAPLAPPIGGQMPETPPPDALSALLIDWREFWTKDHAAEEWIAYPLIPAGRQVALFAPAKTGKSIVTLAAAAAVATGRPVLGERAQAPRHVLYLDYEMTESDLHERLEALGYGAEDDLSHLHYALLPSLPPLNTLAGCEALRALASACQAEAVVIDTMGRAVVGEENSADSYREFARTTGLALKADGRAVLRTDHAGKEKDRGQRGSSAKNDDVDVVLRLDPAEGGWTLTRTHSRVAWVPEKVILERHDTADGTLTVVAARGREKAYAEGTRELVADLRALGATAELTHRALRDLAHGAGMKVRDKRLRDALRWMRDELPTFTESPAEPVDNHVAGVGPHAGPHDFDVAGHTDRATRATDHETPGQSMGHTVGHTGTHAPDLPGHTVALYREPQVAHGVADDDPLAALSILDGLNAPPIPATTRQEP